MRKRSAYRKKGYGGHPFQHIFSFPLDEKILITPKTYNHIIDLLIFIHTRPDEFYERFLYRKIIQKSYKYIIIYITSKSLKNEVNNKIKYESYIYEDILQFNEISSYFNLSIQTVHMICWCSNNIKFKFLLKTDIDVLINIPLILDVLKKIKTKLKYYAIGKISNAYIIRNKKYSHYIPHEIIKESMFPPYLQGVGYFIPFKTINVLIRSIKYVQPKIWIEDVFMGYLFNYSNISLIDISKYVLRDLSNNISSIISNRNNYMLIHGFYPIEMYFLTYNISK